MNQKNQSSDIHAICQRIIDFSTYDKQTIVKFVCAQER